MFTEYAFLATMFGAIAGLLIFAIECAGRREAPPHQRGFVPASLVHSQAARWN